MTELCRALLNSRMIWITRWTHKLLLLNIEIPPLLMLHFIYLMLNIFLIIIIYSFQTLHIHPLLKIIQSWQQWGDVFLSTGARGHAANPNGYVNDLNISLTGKWWHSLKYHVEWDFYFDIGTFFDSGFNSGMVIYRFWGYTKSLVNVIYKLSYEV